MGKRSRRRSREARGKTEHRRRTAAGHHGRRPGHGHTIDPERLLVSAAMASRARAAAYRSLLEETAACWRDPVAGPRLATVLARRLDDAVAGAWSGGWQPADLARVAARTLDAGHGRLCVDVIANEARSYRHHPGADPRWLAQLDELGAAVWWRPGAAHLDQWAAREGADVTGALAVALELLSFLWHLPRLPLLGPPPSEWSRTEPRARRGAGAEPKVLERVRALLAKAESTTFPAEAEALTAKAQELMARHAIDHAMVAASRAGGAGGEGSEQPTGRRVAVDDPYAAAKSMLLHVVADASRCRTVWSKPLGFSTVFGFEADLDAVELLYTSLLVQATTAMLAAGEAGAHRRSRSFRQSFLVGFSQRIGQRLREAVATAVREAAADHGDRLLPVLADRDRAVEDACAEAFPSLQRGSVGANDGAGLVAGTIAADRADLAVGPAVDQAAGQARSA